MANTDGAFGLRPIRSVAGGSVTGTPYKVASNYGTAIYLNDPMVRVATGYIEHATAGAGNAVLGPVIAIFDDTWAPKSYMGATPGVVYNVVVADDPAQEFAIQEDDADGTALTLAACGINAALVAGTGSTTTGRSGWEMDRSTVATTANEQLRLVRPVDTPDNVYGASCNWVVKINNHQNLQGIVGVGI